MNSIAAVVGVSCRTRADSTNTIASCTNARPQNSGPFAKIVRTSVGDDAVNQAVAAVTINPKHIQPYTAFRKVVAWPAAAAGNGMGVLSDVFIVFLTLRGFGAAGHFSAGLGAAVALGLTPAHLIIVAEGGAAF